MARHINKVFYSILNSILQFFLSVFVLVTVCWPRPIFPCVVHAHSLQIKFAFSLKIHGAIHPSEGVWKILPNSHAQSFFIFSFFRPLCHFKLSKYEQSNLRENRLQEVYLYDDSTSTGKFVSRKTNLWSTYPQVVSGFFFQHSQAVLLSLQRHYWQSD